MTTVALTGAGGFLGWHTRCAAHAQGIATRPIALGDAVDFDAAAASLSRADRLIHIAGVNRAPGDEVFDGNVRLVEQLAQALERAEKVPPVIVFANSIQAGNGTAYGRGKQAAADILRAAAERHGVDFVDVRLPNLFGEHGRPFYNSVVATFSHQLAIGEAPRIDQDRELTLLHAQYAADVLLGIMNTDDISALERHEKVSDIMSRLVGIASTYSRGGEIPDISESFQRDLFNTYRAAAWEETTPIRLERRADARGSFFEVARSHGGGGQMSFSTTAPGVTRGEHYHRRKVERFTVLSGEAVIALRRLFTSEVRKYRISSVSPASIDMPTMWAHNITNVSQTELYTAFWSNELFDPKRPDTIAEPV